MLKVHILGRGREERTYFAFPIKVWDSKQISYIYKLCDPDGKFTGESLFYRSRSILDISGVECGRYISGYLYEQIKRIEPKEGVPSLSNFSAVDEVALSVVCKSSVS